jgi:magnesium-transporting ATPase (P-type)
MDTLAALAFGGEPAIKSYMSDSPISRSEAIISPYMWSSIIINGLFIAGFSIVFLANDYFPPLFVREGKPNDDAFLTAFFAFFIFITSINAFNVRTPKINIFDNITNNRGFIIVLTIIFVVQIVFTIIGGKFLRTIPLTAWEWSFLIGISFVIIPWDMVRKIFIVPFLPLQFKDTTGLDDGEGKDKAD